MSMKKLAVDLKAVKKEIHALSKKLDQLSKKADKLIQTRTAGKAKPKSAPKAKAKANPRAAAKAKPKATPAKETAGKTVESAKLTPTDLVLNMMKRYQKGINISKIKELTGFSDKQISNIVHRASKKGRLERVERGVYKLA
jgi:hypothetical protein